jgi:hypothetical protein
MSEPTTLPARSSARARLDVARLTLRALGQVLLLAPRLFREMFVARRRRAAMAELLRRSAARTASSTWLAPGPAASKGSTL